MSTIPPSIKRAITRFDQAARDDEMKGSQDPEDADDIEREYEMARAALERTIQRALTRSSATPKGTQ